MSIEETVVRGESFPEVGVRPDVLRRDHLVESIGHEWHRDMLDRKFPRAMP